MTTTQIDGDRSLLHIMGLWSERGEGRVERGRGRRLRQSNEKERMKSANVTVFVTSPLYVGVVL